MVARARRRKRASATQLYQTCKAAGTCPPDIIPKIEHSTVADNILKYGSLGIFLGGLGIGTGSGTGGRTGYIPVGSRPPTVVDVGPVARPPVVIEPVGASDPSIVTLVEDSSIIQAGAAHPNFTGSGGFEVTTSGTTTPAVLDITPAGGGVQISSSSFSNPLFTEPQFVEAPQTGEVSGHILISTPTSGAHGYEEIPMVTFAQEGSGLEPISSTPLPGVRRLAGPRLYSRAYQQVRVDDPQFVSQPATFVTYDNPVYDPEETILFDRTGLHDPPDPDFLDIVALHRPALRATRQGSVRFSRLGRRATLRTRSGKTIGARVHFYHDLSPISAADNIELQPLLPVDPSGVTPDEPVYDIFADPDALQQAAPSQRSSLSVYRPSVVALSATSSHPSTVPLSAGVDAPVFSGPDVDIPGASPWPQPVPPHTTPQHSIYVHGTDFYLLPGYLFVPKRRKRFIYSFADGYVAA
ncbi:L2 [Colobus guereza papillomavirus 1]|uniref:Minor capsid protein L2 n=1 Tax=Colobus guereza papillomavirus 1 TaxID=2759889 RepID=F8QPQ5_9PAPI|nr:L2 [Colobus guereza papillomavirus 1]